MMRQERQERQECWWRGSDYEKGHPLAQETKFKV